MELTVYAGFILNKCQQPLESRCLCHSYHSSISCIFIIPWHHPLSAPWAVSPRLAKFQAQWAFSKQFLDCQRADESIFVTWPKSCRCPGHTMEHVPSSGRRVYLFRLHHYRTPLPRTPSPNHLPRLGVHLPKPSCPGQRT